MKIRNKLILIGLFIHALISVLLLRRLLFAPGLISRGDFNWPYSSDLYPKYSWHETYQSLRIVNHDIITSWLFIFPPEISSRLIFFLIFFIAGASSFFVIFKLLEENSNKKNYKIIFWSSVVGSLVYVANPIVIIRMGHLFLQWGYSLFPLLFLVSHSIAKNLKEKSIRNLVTNVIILLIILTLMSADPHWIVFGYLVIGCFFFI